MKTFIKITLIAPVVLLLSFQLAFAQTKTQTDDQRRLHMADSLSKAFDQRASQTKQELKNAQDELKNAKRRHNVAKRAHKEASKAAVNAKKSYNLEKKAQNARKKASKAHSAVPGL
jgi:hypothetical protein